METTSTTTRTLSADSPIRAAVYDTVAAADKAVDGLLQAGFTKKEITVMCATDVKEKHFREFEHQHPAGEYAGNASVVGGVIGAALGALTVISGVVASGGLGLVAAGAIVAGAGGMTGTFVGAMMTRGVEKELANFYDQALTGGKILVAVEEHGTGALAKLDKAAAILATAGAVPIPLAEG